MSGNPLSPEKLVRFVRVSVPEIPPTCERSYALACELSRMPAVGVDAYVKGTRSRPPSMLTVKEAIVVVLEPVVVVVPVVPVVSMPLVVVPVVVVPVVVVPVVVVPVVVGVPNVVVPVVVPVVV